MIFPLTLILQSAWAGGSALDFVRNDLSW
jgi:hypothetical protein